MSPEELHQASLRPSDCGFLGVTVDGGFTADHGFHILVAGEVQTLVGVFAATRGLTATTKVLLLIS